MSCCSIRALCPMMPSLKQSRHLILSQANIALGTYPCRTPLTPSLPVDSSFPDLVFVHKCDYLQPCLLFSKTVTGTPAKIGGVVLAIISGPGPGATPLSLVGKPGSGSVLGYRQANSSHRFLISRTIPPSIFLDRESYCNAKFTVHATHEEC